jgi:hypothetical protein
MERALIVAVGCAACWRSPAPPPKPTSDGSAVVERARRVIERQIAVGRAPDSNGRDDVASTAIVFSPQANLAGNAAIPDFGADPHDQVLDAKLVDLVAGVAGSGDPLWATFALAVTLKHDEAPYGTSVTTVRASELFVDGKVAGAAFVVPREPCPCTPPLELPATSAPGPLTALAVDPLRLGAALRDDPSVVVLGLNDDRAVGPAAARALLGKLAAAGPWTLNGKPHEVATATYSILQANLDLGPPAAGAKFPLRVAIEIFALPGPQVVAVHYIAIR